MTYAFHFLELGEIIPMYLYTIISLVMLVLSFFKAGSVLFSMKSYDIMVSLPVNKSAILISRFVTMYVTNLLFALVVMLPGLAVHIYFAKPGLSFYLISIPVVLFAPLLPLTISSILGALIKGISSRMKRKSLVEVLLTMTLVIIVMIGGISMGEQAETTDIDVIKEVLSLVTVELGKIFPPALWYHNALSGNLLQLLLLLFLPALIFFAFVWILSKRFQEICTGLNATYPLAKIESYVNCKCPKCNHDAKRETDTMPQWAGSSWYFLRYCDPNNDNEFASKEALNYWLPVDWYNGGMEHVTRHMIYSRFWHKFLYDIGEVPTAEPYAKRTAQGLILGPDGQKMSKSLGNVVDPNDVVDLYGADVLRVYVLFMGDYEQSAPWSESSMKGCKRFLDRVWGLQDILTDEEGIRDSFKSAFHKTIKKVSEDIEALKFNTAIASLMALINDIYASNAITKEELRIFAMLLNPFAPHITEEIYEQQNFGGVLNEQKWPEFDEALCKDDKIEIVVQINGKVKSKLMINADEDKDTVLATALADEKIKELIDGKTLVKQIYVPNKLVNFVAK